MRLLPIIQKYLQTVEVAASSLRNEFKCSDFLAARRAGTVPKSGVLSDGWSFSFHGTGCRFERDSSVVDVDFGPLGRCDGFDAWRLWQFAQESLGSHEHELAEVEAELNELELNGTVVVPGWNPSPHLYYLVTSVHNGNDAGGEQPSRKNLAFGG